MQVTSGPLIGPGLAGAVFTVTFTLSVVVFMPASVTVR